jgi:hypothetical protein
MPFPIFRSIACVALVSARACGAEEPAQPPTVNAVGAPAVVAVGSAPARERGTMVVAGPTSIEVVPHASGQVYAYPRTGITTPTSTDLDVVVTVEGGTRPVDMRWVESSHRYEGRLTGAVIVPGPTHVTVVLGTGVTYSGAAIIVVVAPAVVVVVDDHRWRGKHKHRGHGWGHGHGHGRGNGHW